MESEEEIFEVLKILARKKNRKGNLEYLVRWKNYGEEDDTWEPIENLRDCEEALEDFNSRLSRGEAIHFDQPPLKRKRATDSPSRDSVISVTSSRGSTPPRTTAPITMNGPKSVNNRTREARLKKPKPKNSVPQKSIPQQLTIRTNNQADRVSLNREHHGHDQFNVTRSPDLASHNSYSNTIRLRRSPLSSLKGTKRQRWEFLSISPKYPSPRNDRENEKPSHDSHRVITRNSPEKERELEDIFLSPRRDRRESIGNEISARALSSFTNGGVTGHEKDLFPAKRVKKSHSVVGAPLQTMSVSDGGVVIVTGRERGLSVSGVESMTSSSGDASSGLISKFSPVVKLTSLNNSKKTYEGTLPTPNGRRFEEKRKASIVARRRLSQSEAPPAVTQNNVAKEDRRSSIRQVENLCKYKEIVVKKCSGYTQIRLFTTTPARNALNTKALQELTAAFNLASKDDSRLIFLSGSGSMFCSGLDLQCLRKHSLEERRKSAKHLANTLRAFIDTVINFPKIIVVAVNGPAVGIGAAILPLCDIVYASDKAWFHFPYALLGQTPEGCSSHTIPEIMGTARASEMLYAGRKLTALEACSSGLVSHVFWPTSLMREVIPRVQKMATTSVKALSMSKSLVRNQQKPRLEYINERECAALEEVWVSADFYRQSKAFLEKGVADL